MRDAILAWTSSFSDSRYMDYNHENRYYDYRGGTFEMQWNFSQALVPSEGGFYFYRLELGTAAKEPFLYFILVAMPPRICRCALFTSSTFFTSR